MQPDVLSEAHEKVARHRLKTLYVAAAVILAGVLLLLVMKYVGTAAKEETQPQPAPQTVPVKTDGDAERLAREQFKRALKEYEATLGDELALTNLSAWNPQAQDEIHALKQQAVSAFSQADYDAALEMLKDLGQLTGQTLAEWNSRYSHAFGMALKQFEQMSPDRAKLSIEAALLLKPAEQDALTLQQRIAVLPEVKQLLDEAGIALVENDIRKRYRLLQQVTRLDPLRVELQDEISHLKKSITEEDYIAFINAGLKAVAQNRLAAARTALQNARAIFPKRRETQILTSRISSLARSQSLAYAINKADDAARRDDWAFALRTYQQALKQHPDNGELIDKINLSRRIVSLNQSISDYVDRHDRLSSLKVAASAEQTLRDAAEYTDRSSSLASRSAELARLLARYDQPADLLINSDNQTYITIRGVGKVGAVKQKQISLRPGKYTLEGKRQGYKSKLFNIEIGLEQRRLEIVVICDERI